MSCYSMCHFILVLYVISCLLCLNTSSSMSSKPLLVVFVVSLNIKRNWITSWKLQLTFSRTQMHHQVLLNRTINDKVTKCYAKLAVVYLIELPNNSTNQDDMFALKMSILFIIMTLSIMRWRKVMTKSDDRRGSNDIENSNATENHTECQCEWSS